MELIEEKDSLSAVERKNKDRLQQELTDFVAALDTVTDNHIRTLKEANLNDAGRLVFPLLIVLFLVRYQL